MNSAKTALLILATAGLTVFVTYRITKSPEANQNTKAATATSTKAPARKAKQVRVEKNELIYEGMLTVEAGKTWVKEITVPKDAVDAQVIGRFEAAGGNRDDVRVLITTPDDYTNWTSGNEASAVFQTKRSKVSNIESPPLQPGRYLFVIDNTHAWMLPRNVSLNARLRYAKIETVYE